MTELCLESMSKAELVEYLVGHIHPSAGENYKAAARGALYGQSTETLLAMAKRTSEAELERQEKRRAARATGGDDEHKHTTTSGAR